MTSFAFGRPALVAAAVALSFVSISGAAHAQGEPTPPPAPPVAEPAPASPPATSAPPETTPKGAPAAAPPGSTLPDELRPKSDDTKGAPGEKKDGEKKDDEEGSRLTELLWLNGELGGSYANMTSFSVENLGITKDSGGGFMAGIGAGIRIVVVSLGVKLRWHKLSTFNLVQANGELLFKLPISKVDVLIGGHGGYSGVGSLNDLFASNAAQNATTAADLTSNVSVRGWNAGIDLGFDYFITNYFSLGLGLTGDFLYLQRPKSAPPEGFSDLPPEVQAEYLNSDVAKYDGKSAGFGFAGALRIGLHLGP
jgi:hypothetical protein